ncbi:MULTISPECIES: DUF4179 domain-containing protein [Eubacteriales]|uniref:DUF4179 domain-containing protein n=1 Tax=Bittarella massiliensis (ex Durand et al. 2017) TaxID=1720313 RepID=A0AAQ1MG13_9FIRM|nr:MULTISPECIES: DUF4179 domain-containing protein [Eubacteriales]MZL69677.1 DUF4179 domain-containing protein [Bittarella massiliensis (ex Durand et al. 2017)]MZL80851.1 DUF4179 domain-containing protein [Bittarella massiliensis (ex Durand et al. 2017)]SHG51894.1 protein of unknown function [Bittarella massiliensis (ex Durand et al. 2017)]
MKLSNWMDLLPAEEMARLIRQEEEPPLDAIWAKAQRRAERVKKAEKQHAKRWKRGLLIAAAVCVAAAGTALAAAIFRWNQPLVEQYNPPETIREELIQTGKDLNYRVEHDGVAVTFQQVIGDENEIKVLCQVESVDGRGWQGGFRTKEFFLDGTATDWQVCQGGFWEQAGDATQGNRQNGKALQNYTFSIQPQESIDERVVTIRLSDFFYSSFLDLYNADIDEQTATPDIANTWEVSFRVDYDLLLKTERYHPNLSITAGDDWTLSEIAVSPLTVRVVLTPQYKDARFLLNDEGRSSEEGAYIPIILYFNDGTVRILETTPGGGKSQELTYLGKNYWAIDTSQIRAMAVGTITKADGSDVYEPKENPEDYTIYYYFE